MSLSKRKKLTGRTIAHQVKGAIPLFMSPNEVGNDDFKENPASIRIPRRPLTRNGRRKRRSASYSFSE